MKKPLMIAAVVAAMALMCTTLSADPSSMLNNGLDQQAPALVEAEVEAVVAADEIEETAETPQSACNSQTDMLADVLPQNLAVASARSSDCTVSLSACLADFSHWIWECRGSDCGGEGRAYRLCCCANSGGFGCMSSWQSTQICC